jgi:hypothetical protein
LQRSLHSLTVSSSTSPCDSNALPVLVSLLIVVSLLLSPMLLIVILYLNSHMDDVVGIVLSLLEKNLMTIAEILGSTKQVLKDAIKGSGGLEDEDEDAAKAATEIYNIAGNMNAEENFSFPTTLEGLVNYGVDDTVARMMLMQQVFGSTELVIGLNTWKVVCVLDMFDWEASGVKQKGDIKMKNITAGHVRLSVLSWLPKGSAWEFQESMEALGEIIGRNKLSLWGKLISIIGKNFSPKEKKIVTAMAKDIL